MGRESEYTRPRRMGDCSLFHFANNHGIRVSEVEVAINYTPDKHVAEALFEAGLDRVAGRIITNKVVDCRDCNLENPNRQCDFASLISEVEPHVNDLVIFDEDLDDTA